jgi:D-glycero-D-manno-heptose 1,7-bisphosphate phosphatase
MTAPLRGAAFLDRDGTIIHDANYIGKPSLVELLPGAADAIRRLNEALVPVIVITNQAGIARGLFTEQDYETVRARVDELLAAQGARVDGTYMCPHHPEFDGPCDCRKPQVALHREAAAEHGIDFARSLFIGDRLHDVTPAMTLGGRGILIEQPSTPEDERSRARQFGFEIVDSLAEAVRRALPAAPMRI